MALRERMSAVCIGVSFLVREEISARQLVVEARQDLCTNLMLQRVPRDEHPGGTQTERSARGRGSGATELQLLAKILT